MGFLPRISGREAVRAFIQDGWSVARQRGSHIILIKEGSFVSLSVPDHKELATGTLRSLVRASELTIKEFLDLM